MVDRPTQVVELETLAVVVRPAQVVELETVVMVDRPTQVVELETLAGIVRITLVGDQEEMLLQERALQTAMLVVRLSTMPGRQRTAEPPTEPVGR